MSADYATVTEILDRMQAIHQEALPTYKAVRYWPRDPKTQPLPLITALPAAAQYDKTTFGETNVRTNRTFLIIVWVWDWNLGIPTQTTQERSEAILDEVMYAYWQRPRLEILVNGRATPLDGIVEDVTLSADTSLTADRELGDIRFTVNVPTERTITKLGDEP